MAKILLVGGCGYIGSRLLIHLKAKQHTVQSVDLEWRGNPAGHPNIRVDYRNWYGYRDYDTVLWVAGHSSVGACEKDPRGAFENNLTGLVELTKKLEGQRLMHASSSCIYAVRGLGFHNMLDYTKAAAESVLKLLYPECYFLRFGSVAGPSPNLRLDLMVNRMVYDAVTTGRVTVFNADARRPILGMNDLCLGVDAVLQNEFLPGQYNFVSFNTTVGSIASVISHRLGVEVVHGIDNATYDFTMAGSFLPTETSASIVDSLVAEYGDVWRQEKKRA